MEQKKHKKHKPFVHVNVGFLTNDVGETATDTFDGGKGEHDLLLAIDIGVQNTKNVLKILVRYQRLQ